MDLPGSSPGLVAKSLSLFRLSLVESHTQLLRQLDQKIRELEKAEGQGQWRLWLEGEVVRDKVFVYANERVAAVQKRMLTDSFLENMLTPNVLCSIHCDVSKHTSKPKVDTCGKQKPCPIWKYMVLGGWWGSSESMNWDSSSFFRR